MATPAVKIRGLAELKAKLAKLPVDLEKKVLRKGVTAAARVILRQALANARAKFQARSGLLFRSFGISVRRRKDGKGVSAVVGIRGDAFYARFLEKGWRAIGRGKGRRAQLRRGSIQGKRIPGRPFMEPALEAKADEAVREMEKAIVEYIDKLPSK